MGDYMVKLTSSNEKLEKIQDYGILNYHVLESMADWVRVIDLNGYVIYANKAMTNILGKDMIGKKCGIVCEDGRTCTTCLVDSSILNNKTVQKERIIDGKYYSVKASPIKDSMGKIIGAVEVFRDVTRERELENKLVEQNKKMNKDLMLARKIQQRILPKKGRFSNLNIDYIYKPSEILSGDMFDIFQIDDENIGIYVSDVVGHGVAASMMTMFIRQSMRFIKDDILSPSIALSELHRRFLTLDFDIDRYFTIFYGVFNTNTYQFKYANAGHNSIPIKFNSEKGNLEELKISGYPISCLFENIVYKEKKIELEKGDKILLFTDGITEVKDENGKEFGSHNLKKLISKTDANVLELLYDSIENFALSKVKDDYAILLVEVVN